MASGRTLAELAAEFARQPGAFADWRVELTRLDRAPAELEKRIETRVAVMLQAGLVEEVRRLRAAGLEQNPSAARAIGYREVLAVLDGQLPETQHAVAGASRGGGRDAARRGRAVWRVGRVALNAPWRREHSLTQRVKDNPPYRRL